MDMVIADPRSVILDQLLDPQQQRPTTSAGIALVIWAALVTAPPEKFEKVAHEVAVLLLPPGASNKDFEELYDIVRGILDACAKVPAHSSFRS